MSEQKQTVLIGLGGTGSRVVNNVARMLRERNIDINDGKVTCVVLDTNMKDVDKIRQTGTDVPVIATGANRQIKDYFARYANRRISEWCPYNRDFGEKTILDGASEMRFKSRIAFMDTIESGKILQLQQEIEKVFHRRSGQPEQVRVMVVSSLAGGTGSGMFLQVALWLRQYFQQKNCLCSIRGVLLLPDVFVSTIDNIRDNPSKPMYLYANAYAAIRELNAINKVIKNKEKNKLDRPMIIDGLFHSDNPPASPVFDHTFFIDDVAQSGAAFTSSEAYEKMVAQAAFMQLYAPMESEMVSVEDNQYRSITANPEPTYGSCGTSKAVYPVDDVVEYCSIRAAQDAIAQGWNCLDSEIQAKKDELKQAQRDGHKLDEQIITGDVYIDLFKKKAGRTGKEIGKSDRLFVTIKNDVNHVQRVQSGDSDKPEIVTVCKVERYLKTIRDAIKSEVGNKCDVSGVTNACAELYEKEPKDFTREDIPALKALREAEEDAVRSCLEEIDQKKDKMVESIMSELVPLDMGEISDGKKRSVYNLFIKENLDGGQSVVHPVAARYMLYKLQQIIEQEQRTLVSADSLRAKAEEGDDEIDFDIVKTKTRKETREEYFSQLGLIISKDEIAHFVERYKKYNEKNQQLCADYALGVVRIDVMRRLSEYVKMLITEMETLFGRFGQINKELADSLQNNIERNDAVIGNNMFVYAKREHKAAMYESLGMDVLSENDALNESVVKALYGKFCYRNRPSTEDNQKYCDMSIDTLVYQSLLSGYTEMIVKEYKNIINLNIVDAIYAESDFDAPEETISLSQEMAGDSLAKRRALRHAEALLAYKNQLEMKASPFLRVREDYAVNQLHGNDGLNRGENDTIWMPSDDGHVMRVDDQNKLTFWGFHTELGEKDAALPNILGVNTATCASRGYSKNELCCYRSIYGVQASKIDKFNEMTGGAYYVNYSAVINRMIKTGEEIRTPHLDKTWHEFLPYISPEREQEAQKSFGKSFWRALAYQRVTLDGHKHYQLVLREQSIFGKPIYNNVPLLDEHGLPIERTDICGLVKALRVNAAFNAQVTEEMEDDYLKDVSGKNTFRGSKLISALQDNAEINPFNLLGKFQRAGGYDVKVKLGLLAGLQALIEDMANKLDIRRTAEASVEKATFKQLYKLYEKSNSAYKSLVVLESGWIDDFVTYDLMSKKVADEEMEKAEAEANAAEEVDE